MEDQTLRLEPKYPPTQSEAPCGWQKLGRDLVRRSLLKSYSRIARQLQVGRTLAFLLARSDFKSETSFGFLSPDYTGQPT